jgi:hypothetical protein
VLGLILFLFCGKFNKARDRANRHATRRSAVVLFNTELHKAHRGHRVFEGLEIGGLREDPVGTHIVRTTARQHKTTSNARQIHQ